MGSMQQILQSCKIAYPLHLAMQPFIHSAKQDIMGNSNAINSTKCSLQLIKTFSKKFQSQSDIRKLMLNLSFNVTFLLKLHGLVVKRKSTKKHIKKNIFSLVDTPLPPPPPLSGLSARKIFFFCNFPYINKKIKVVQFTHESINQLQGTGSVIQA